VRWRRYPNRRLSLPARSKTLPGIARAVGDQVEVVLDGGVRRGDVAKALALGAKAVMIGRAYLWGLAANGQAGVENVLDLLHAGLDSALLGLGHSSVSDIPPPTWSSPAASPAASATDGTALLVLPRPARPLGRLWRGRKARDGIDERSPMPANPLARIGVLAG
jgi:pre-mycofactocin synthase